MEKGEVELPDAETTVTLELKHPVIPTLAYGNGALSCKDGVYKVTIPAGGVAVVKIK